MCFSGGCFPARRGVPGYYDDDYYYYYHYYSYTRALLLFFSFDSASKNYLGALESPFKLLRILKSPSEAS